MSILKRGLRGEPVRRLQAKLGIDADGIFGKGTAAALRAYQSENGLAVDGIAGPDTFYQMGLYELILLKKGSRGETVKKLQRELSTGDDGIFGKGTEAKVKAFQEEHSLTVDGIAGPLTLLKMDSFNVMNQSVVDKYWVPKDYVDPEVPEGFQGEEEDKVAAADIEETKEDKGVWGTVKGWFS